MEIPVVCSKKKDMRASWKKISIVTLVLLGIAGGILYFALRPVKVTVPADFTTARSGAASVSQDIVSLTEQTDKTIQEVNTAQTLGNTDQVLGLIDSARNSNAQAYAKAMELSDDLQHMTESLSQISSRASQQTAYNAIAIELSLTSEFITYTGALNDFLNTLAKTVTVGGFETQKELSDKLAIVNEKVASINNLNGQFNEKMREFDASL